MPSHSVQDFSNKQEYTTAGTETFVVPAGITRLRARLWGSGGWSGQASGALFGRGGGGGYVSGEFTVTPGETLNCRVGQRPTSVGAEYSAIWRGTETQANMIMLAGGAGNGGAGNSSQSNAYGGAGGGGGGTTGGVGTAGAVAGVGTGRSPGGGGTQSAGGAGGNVDGNAGSALTGGGGQAGIGAASGGGGGGDGYYGGGSGGRNSNTTVAAGGGGGAGGSSFISGGVTDPVHEQGQRGDAGGQPGGTSDQDYPGAPVGRGGQAANVDGDSGAVILRY